MNIGMVFGAAFVLSFYAGANYYVGKRIFQCLGFLFPHMNGAAYAAIYILIALTLIIGFLPLPSGVKGLVSWIGSYWMGVFAYLFMLLLAADMALLLASILRIVPAPAPPGIRFYAGLCAVLLSACLVGCGIRNAKRIHYASYEVRTQKSALSGGMKIVLISDLHLGAVNSEKRLEGIVRGINGLEPDIVCIAGDIFNNDYKTIRNPERAIGLLQSIASTYGVYACLGNHDGGSTFHEMARLLEESDIRLLNDECVVIDERLVLWGRVDASPIGGFGGLKRKDVMDFTAPHGADLPVVVMDHNPSGIAEYGGEVDLILSGHTHKGQIFPANLITNAVYEVDYGYYRKDADSPHVIVTSGAGTWGTPMRVGTNSEIVSILLR